MSQQRMSTHVSRGVAWLGTASALVGVLDLVAIIIILNNWVSTEEYGIATKCIWIFPILDQVTDLGLSAALIQRDDHTAERISTVFWINFALSALLFGLLALVAPPLAEHFYHAPIVGWMLIAYGVKLIAQNGYTFPFALMKRELRFKEVSVVKIAANIAEFLGKVGFAWAGFGIWCFVLGPIARTVVYVIGAQIAHPYRPRWTFNLKDAKEYVSFGLRTSGSQMMFYFYTNVDYPIVGALFGNAALGLYRLAYEVVLEPVRIISNVVVDAAFPAFARLRHDRDMLVKQFVSLTRLNLITVMSFAALVLAAAPDLIHLLFPGFEGATAAARILCAVAVLRAVGFVVPPLLDGLGHPERTLKYMTTAAVFLPASYLLFGLLLGPHLGFESVAIAWAAGYPIAFGVLIFMATQTLGWSVLAYLREISGVALCLLAAGVVAAGVRYPLLGVPTVLRFAVTAATLVLVSGLLLAYTQGISLRTAMRSLKDPPKDPTQADT